MSDRLADTDLYDEPPEQPGVVELTPVELAVMELRPGWDHTLVVMSDEPLSQPQRFGVRDMLAQQFPDLAGEGGRKVLILDCGKRLAVVSRLKAEQAKKEGE